MMAAMLGSSVVVVSRDQVSADLDGEAVILGFAKGVYYGLDAAGARVWNLIQTPRTVDEVCAALVEEYDVDPDRCRGDLFALFERLVAEGLVEVDDESPA